MQIIPFSGLSLCDPDSFITDSLRSQLADELDIAHEIFLARQCVKIHYADLMDDIPAGCASKDRLLGWVRDSGSRSGILTLYKAENPSHFEGGMWRARYYAQFVRFAHQRLTDKTYVSKTIALEFSRSFEDAKWRNAACLVLALKLMEDVNKWRGLRSHEAQRLIEANLTNREMLSKVGAIVGRSTKNHSADASLSSEIKYVIEEAFKHQHALAIKQPAFLSEVGIFEKYELRIHSALREVFQVREERLQLL